MQTDKLRQSLVAAEAFDPVAQSPASAKPFRPPGARRSSVAGRAWRDSSQSQPASQGRRTPQPRTHILAGSAAPAYTSRLHLTMQAEANWNMIRPLRSLRLLVPFPNLLEQSRSVRDRF